MLSRLVTKTHIKPNRIGPRLFGLRLSILIYLVLELTSISPNIHADEKIDSLKATYVFYFIRFTEWKVKNKASNNTQENTTSSQKKRNIALCTATKNKNIIREFKAIQGKAKKSNTELTIIDITNKLDQYKQCQIVYIAKPLASKFYSSAQGFENILLITEADQENRKGTINFIINGTKLGFEINREKENKSRISISSKLLRLATKVTEN